VHQQRPFELIHAFWADEPGYIAVRAAKRLGIPAVVSILGGELVHLKSIKYGHQGSFAARWLIERSIKQADAVTVGSKRLYEIAKARVDTHRLKIAPLGVDTELFTPSSHEISDSKRLLNIASLSPVKNQHFLLRVFAKVLDHLPNTHLDIVGDGSERAALEKLVERLGIRTQVTFHGDISHEQLPAFYQSAALCLLTSHHESQSLVALEAAACQKLTVGTPVGILPELVPEQYLSPDEDVLAKQIVGLLTDAEQREHLAQVAYERVMRYFSLDASIVRWREMYNAISSELSK